MKYRNKFYQWIKYWSLFGYAKNHVSWKKRFSMDLRHEIILSVVSYGRKNIIFHEKISNLRKIILLIMFFVIAFFYYYTLPTFLKLLDFYKSWLIFSGKIFFTPLLFSILKVKFLIAKIVKRIFKKKHFLNNYIVRFYTHFQKWQQWVLENILPEK